MASSANGLLSKLEPPEVVDHSLPGHIAGPRRAAGAFRQRDEDLAVAFAHLSLGRQSRLTHLSFISVPLSEHPHAVLMGA